VPWLAALGLAACAAAAVAQAPPPGVPALDPAGRVRWTARPDSLPAWARGLALPPRSAADSLAMWERASARPHLAAWALDRIAAHRLAAGDTARADSCWARALEAPSPWAWPALRGRVAIAEARGDRAFADALLEQADRAGWPDAERAAWLATRVRLRAALGDTAQAIAFALQALRAYPSSAAAPSALERLAAMLRARGDTLAAADERAAAEVDVLRGDRAGAARRLRRALPRLAPAERRAATLRLAEILRGARRLTEALAATRDAYAAAPDSGGRAAALLERARVHRDAGRVDSALAGFARAAAATSDPALRDAAYWEAGREAEDEDRWEVAAERFALGAANRGRRAREAGFRAGLAQLAAGRPDSASAWWAADTSDAARFWWGIAQRALGRGAAGDSALRRVALRPGYAFHRAAARDSLGLRAAPRPVAAAGCAPDSACGALALARDLAALGADDEVALVLSRWNARDPRLPGATPDALPPAARLEAARLAHAAGRIGQGVTFVDAAARALEAAGSDSAAAAAWAWAFPPAFESLFVAPRDTAVAAIEPALLFAIAHQESRFDPRARSRSNALGLMQLKRSTAGDVARWVGDPRPTEAALFDPARNVRYGARYLRHLLGRFDGHVAVALSAYNAGPGSLPPRWRDLIARGGEALFAEIASNPDAQDYTRKILGFRRAYRELRPTAR
jgi:soluble lytic murein transglycosylase-like protein/tetratricopeptide (TPR) repeat protein